MRIAVTKPGEEANEEAEVWMLSGEKARVTDFSECSILKRLKKE
jgi:hypothetical protein